MNKIETRKKLTAVAERYVSEFDFRLAALPADARLERKSLSLLRSFAANARGFVEMGTKANAYRRVFEQEHYFDAEKPRVDALPPKERDGELVYLFAVTMVRSAFLDKRRAVLESPDSSVEAKFEARMIVDLYDKILAEWK